MIIKNPFYKLLLFIFISASFLISCNKSNDSSQPKGPYYISYTTQDSTYTYSLNAFSTINMISGTTVCSVTAQSKTNAFGIDISSSSNIKTGFAYTDTSATNTAEFQLNTIDGDVLSSSYYAATPSVKVVFSMITSTFAQGTFSGNWTIMIGGATTAVTNGKFYLPVK